MYIEYNNNLYVIVQGGIFMATFTINKKGGYEIEEVDSYIRNLEQQLLEYKNKSAAINKAIISAQVASDNMIKTTQEESSNLIQRAKEDAAAIKKQAEAEAHKIIEQAKDRAVELKKNSKGQFTEIKASISSQKELINDISKDYSALVNKLFNSGVIEEFAKLKDKYNNSSYQSAINSVQSKLDEIDAMADDLAMGGESASAFASSQTNNKPVSSLSKPGIMKVPKEPEKPAPAKPTPVHREPNTAPLTKPGIIKVSAEVEKPEEPKAEPKPVTASFSKPATANNEEEKPFIKTGLNAGSAMNGIPVQKTYDTSGQVMGANGLSANAKPGIYRVPSENK